MTGKSLFIKKSIVLLLIISILASMLSGCAKTRNSEAAISSTDIDREKIVTETASAILQDIASEQNSEPPFQILLSENWEDYEGDIDTIVYGLVASQLQCFYDVFPAYVELNNGNVISGIAYTDYSECYITEDESEYYFTAGFLPYIGEYGIPQDEFDSGLAIHTVEYTDEEASFFLAYTSEAFTEHCVIYGQYIQYGVSDSGQLFYTACDYNREICDLSLGALYSYDEARYLYDTDFGNYTYIAGASLYREIDFDSFEQEINRILKAQDMNFATVDVESCAYIAQGAVTAYLLSLQEETILGYSVSALIAAAESLDPLECYRLTENGLTIAEFNYDGGASELTKWLVGTGCVLVIAASSVCSMVSIECPPLSAASSAVAGMAIEIFMEVVISGETLSNVNWGKVAAAAVTGAVSGFLGPYIQATFQGVGYFAVDSLLDGFVGGLEHAALAWMAGENGTDIISAFGYGLALGFCISAGFKVAGMVVEKLLQKIGPELSRLAETVFPKLSSKASKLFSDAASAIYELRKLADSSPFHSEYISKRMARRQLLQLIESNSSELKTASLNQLSVEDIFDKDGNAISKNTIADLYENADDGATLAFYNKGGEQVAIVKKNGILSIEFDSSKYQNVSLPNGLTNNRSNNFENAAKLYKDSWLDDPALMPESIAKTISESGIDLETLTPRELVDIIRKSGWTLHENADLLTITLIPKTLHEAISHMGAIGLINFLKSRMGIGYIDQLLYNASTGLVRAAA